MNSGDYSEEIEKAQEYLDEHILEEFMEHTKDEVQCDFLWWLYESMPKKDMEGYLNNWLLTKDGKQWFESRVEKLVDDRINDYGLDIENDQKDR